MIKIQIDGGSDGLKARADRMGTHLAKGMKQAAELAGVTARDELRKQAASFMKPGSTRAVKAIQMFVYPRGEESIGAASVTVMRGDWWQAHATGVTIKAQGARWLVIPLPEAKKLRLDRSFSGGRSTRGMRLTKKKADIPEGLQFIPINSQRALLVLPARQRITGRRGARQTQDYKRGLREGPDTPMFLLVRQVRLPKRMSIETAETKGGAVYLTAVKLLVDALKL